MIFKWKYDKRQGIHLEHLAYRRKIGDMKLTLTTNINIDNFTLNRRTKTLKYKRPVKKHIVVQAHLMNQ